MSDENMPGQAFLNTKLGLSKELDKAQRTSRAALKVACESGSADIVMQLAIAIQAIDKAWHINNEQVKELWEATTPKNGVIYSAPRVSRNIYHAPGILLGDK